MGPTILMVSQAGWILVYRFFENATREKDEKTEENITL